MVTNTLFSLHTYNELRDRRTYTQMKPIFACFIWGVEIWKTNKKTKKVIRMHKKTQIHFLAA